MTRSIENPDPTAPLRERVDLALEIAHQIEALATSLATVVAPEHPRLAEGWTRRVLAVADEVMRQYPIDDRRWVARARHDTDQTATE